MPGLPILVGDSCVSLPAATAPVPGASAPRNTHRFLKPEHLRQILTLNQQVVRSNRIAGSIIP